MARTIETGTANAKRIYDFLKANAGTSFTYGQIATELGFEGKTAKILGTATSLKKKGVLIDGDVVIIDEKEYKTLQIADANEEVVFVEKIVETKKGLTDKAIALLKVLQDGKAQTTVDIAAILGMAPIAITGVMTPLVKRELLKRIETSVAMPNNGGTKTLLQFQITDLGLTELKENL